MLRVKPLHCQECIFVDTIMLYHVCSAQVALVNACTDMSVLSVYTHAYTCVYIRIYNIYKESQREREGERDMQLNYADSQ